MPYDIRFKTPFNCIVAGMSYSGKTTWVKNLLTLRDKIFTEQPTRIFLFYKVMQDIYVEMEADGLVHELVTVNEEMPSLETIISMVEKYKNQGGSMLIFDDTMSDLNNDFEQLFCNVSHHYNSSIIFLTQNLFYQKTTFRTMSLNSHYLVLMKNVRDTQQISILAKQFSPYNNSFLVQSYAEATKNPFSYLLLDFRPDSPQELRLRSNLFEFPCLVFLPKQK